MNIYKISLAALTIFSNISCIKEANKINENLTEKTMLNVGYGTDPFQKMDIYLPQGRTSSTTKVMVMIHGGGWTGGDKIDLAIVVDSMKKRLPGYAIFNINYRLAKGNSNLFPTQENDVKSAMDFIFNNKALYAISDKWVLIGASAGAHLAMLQGYKYSSPIRPKAIASFFGPSDMAAMYNDPVGGNPLLAGAIFSIMGGTPYTLQKLYANSSPVNFINSNTPPTIFIHGGADPLVRPEQSTTAQTKLNTAGVNNQYVFYPDGGHGNWDPLTYTDAFNKIQSFFAINNP